MKRAIYILAIVVLIQSLLTFCILTHKPSIDQKVFFDTVTNFCSMTGCYSKKIDYFAICKHIEAKSKLFKHDKYLIVAVGIFESSLYTNAVHTNINGTIDQGIFQINNIWNGELLTPNAPENPLFTPGFNTYAGCYVFSLCRSRSPDSIFRSVWRYNGLGEHNHQYPEQVLEIYYQLNLIRQKKEQQTIWRLLWQ